MTLQTFVRFHAREGQEEAVADAMREACADVRGEAGCAFIGYFRSTRDNRLFYIHSGWKDEATFALHAGLPHTVRFLARVEPLIDHPFDVVRATQFL